MCVTPMDPQIHVTKDNQEEMKKGELYVINMHNNVVATKIPLKTNT